MEEKLKTDEREIKEIDQAAEDYAEEQELDQYKYIAFISYRHLEPDATVAKKIHTMIETFKLPKEFYVNGKTPNFRVFRDREELTTSSLTDSIDVALNTSKFLIVICSKRLPESEWCNKEVDTFIKLRGVDRVIPVLIEGEPEDSFPDALLNNETKVELEDGSVIVENKNILAAELRTKEVMDKDFVGYKELSLSNTSEVNRLAKESVGLLKTEKYRIMAAILGVSYGDLKQRDKARRQRSMLILSAIISFALTFFGIFMFNAYRSENLAKRQTIQDRSQFMLDESNVLLTQGDRYQALLTAHQAMSDVDAEMENYQKLKSEHFQILNDAINPTKSNYNKVINTGNQYTFLTILDQKNYFVAGLNNDSIGIWDIDTGKLVNSAKGHSQQVKILDKSTDEKTIVSGGFDDLIITWNADTLEKMSETKTPGNIMLAQFSDNNDKLHVIYDTIDNYFYQSYDVSNLEPIGAPIQLNPNVKRVTFDEEGKFMWVVYSTFRRDASLIKYDLENSVIAKQYPDIVVANPNYVEPADIETDKTGEDATKDTEKTTEDPFNTEFDYIPYADLKRSKDRNHLYLLNGGHIMKLNMATDEILFTLETKKTVYDNLIILESEDSDSFYSIDVSSIYKYNSKTGEKELEIFPGGGLISDAKISYNGSTIIASTENGEILIVRNDVLVEQIPNLDNSIIEYLYTNKDGSDALTLSLTQQKVKILEIAEEETKNTIDGQIAGISKEGNYSLIYSKNEYLIWDNIKNTKYRDIHNEYLPNQGSIVYDGSGFILTDDARYLSGLIRNTGTLVETHPEIFVLDTETNEVVYEVPVSMTTFYYGFSSDGSLLMLTTGLDEITIYSVQDKKEVDKIIIEKGFISGIDISKDNKYLVVNYSEGVANVYDIANKEKVGNVVGNILDITTSDEGDIDIVSIYNNVGSKYRNFEKTQEDVVFNDKMKEHGSTYEDIYKYNKNADLLLAMKTKEYVHYAYLVDFKTGDLIQSYVTPITSYSAKGVIAPDAKSVIMDYLYSSNTTSEEQYNPIAKIAIYPIETYDTLYDKAEQIVQELGK